MSTPRAIGFIDGENLVMRYQAMVADGAAPKEDVTHIKDCFVWHEEVTAWSMFDFIRINYYTSTVGDEPRVEQLKDAISECEYSFTYVDGQQPGTANLVPHVFHKPKRNLKARNVDLQISIDVLRAAHLQNVDMIFILSGDGDYIPLIQEAARLGKEVWLGALSSGLHPKLKHHVDVCQNLDDMFFKSLPKS